MAAFDESNVKLYVLSYDSHKAIANFSQTHNITFTMLSDPDSIVIKDFGILNTLIPEDAHPWFGIPFPGTYIINDQGIITTKIFENIHHARPGPEQLLAAALGERFSVEPMLSPTENVNVDVAFHGDSLPTGITREIVATIRVPEGKHIYSEPVPEGLVATSIELDSNSGIVAYTPVQPKTSPLTLTGSDTTLQVYEGNTVLRLPVAQNGQLIEKTDEGNFVTVSGKVHWQACDDKECDLPESVDFEFRIKVESLNVPELSWDLFKLATDISNKKPHQKVILVVAYQAFRISKLYKKLVQDH
jgi:DsbC/DsbD-like thiol-disulfide interchange protein